MKRSDFLNKKPDTNPPKKVVLSSGDTYYVRSITQYELAVLSAQCENAYGVGLEGMGKVNSPAKQLKIIAYVTGFALCEEDGTPWFKCGMSEEPDQDYINISEGHIVTSIPLLDLQALTEAFLEHNAMAVDDQAYEDAKKNLQAMNSDASS